MTLKQLQRISMIIAVMGLTIFALYGLEAMCELHFHHLRGDHWCSAKAVLPQDHTVYIGPKELEMYAGDFLPTLLNNIQH
jgi:hypothetical protein